jgi:hypothetical protein
MLVVQRTDASGHVPFVKKSPPRVYPVQHRKQQQEVAYER